MKKTLLSAISIIMALVLSSCGLFQPQNRVVGAKLTEREKQLLSVVSDTSYVYDFNVSDDYKSVKLSLEEYRKGELAGEYYMPSKVQKSGTMIFVMGKSESSSLNDKRPYFMSITSGEGNLSISGTLTGPSEVEVKGRGITNADGKTIPLPDSGKLVLGMVVYTDSGSLDMLYIEEYKDPEKTGELLKEYPLAYILRCEFSKEVAK